MLYIQLPVFCDCFIDLFLAELRSRAWAEPHCYCVNLPKFSQAQSATQPFLVSSKNGYVADQVKRTPQDSINEFIIRKLNPLVVVDFRFISAFLHA